MDNRQQEQVALHRWAVIAEAANHRLTAAERGALVRRIAARAHTHPDGSARRYSRGTIDRWLRAWRAGGLEALRPVPRADTGTVRAHPELFAEAAALRLELPGRSAAQIASILFHRHGGRAPLSRACHRQSIPNQQSQSGKALSEPGQLGVRLSRHGRARAATYRRLATVMSSMSSRKLADTRTTGQTLRCGRR